MRRIAGTAIVTAMLVCVAATSRAEVAIEAHDGRRSAGVATVMERVRTILLEAGIEARPSDVRSVIRQPGLPAIVDRSLTYAKLTEQIEIGSKLFLTGERKDVPAACQQLRSAVEAAHANPGIIIQEEGARELLTRALALLGLCLARIGDPAGAAEAISEQIRSYPERPITRGVSGTEAEKLYAQTRATTDRAPRGKLLVKVTSPDARIFINEFGRGRGGSFSADFVPGKYRVLVQVGGEMRRYDVVVGPDQTLELSLDWKLELALTISDAWVGIATTGPASEQRELELVRALSAKTGRTDLMVVRVQVDSARSEVTLASYRDLARADDESGGRRGLVRRARVELDGRDDDPKLRALIAFVKTGTAAAGVVDATRGESSGGPHTASSRIPSSAGSTVFPKLLVGAGIASILTGGVLLAIDEDPDPQGDFTFRNSAPGGAILGVVGVASVGVGTLLWIRARHRSLGLTVSLWRSGPSLVWAGTF